MADAIESYLVDVPGVFVQEVLGLVLPGPYMVKVGGLVGDESGKNLACRLLGLCGDV